MSSGCAAFQASPPRASFRRKIATAPIAAGPHRVGRTPPIPLPHVPPKMSSTFSDSGDEDDGGSGEAERLRRAASRLRAEAQAAERALRRPPSPTSAEGTNNVVEPVEYSDLKDSCWEITYRFANEPESDKNSDYSGNTNILHRTFYGGGLQIQLRGDGYTDVISPADDISDSTTATFKKVWGWDLETSTEDSLDYLLFSADVSLPPPVSTAERFYFQARVEMQGKEEDILSLQDGSVAVKRNVDAPAGGWWGIFRGADGILAQFQQVGQFRCCPIKNPNTNLR